MTSVVCCNNKQLLMVSPIPLPASCFHGKCFQWVGVAFSSFSFFSFSPLCSWEAPGQEV